MVPEQAQLLGQLRDLAGQLGLGHDRSPCGQPGLYLASRPSRVAASAWAWCATVMIWARLGCGWKQSLMTSDMSTLRPPAADEPANWTAAGPSRGLNVSIASVPSSVAI